jgi:mutual gliding-motility protein MglA
MALYNPSSRELTAKIVYYGPGLSGKTSNLKYIYEHMEDEARGKMLSLSSDADRTILFDFLPLDMGDTRDAKVRIQLYTVPGQVFYDETRKKVLKGVDGIVFVADSQAKMAESNVHSLKQMRENLEADGLDADGIPLVLQYNKRDLKEILDLETIDEQLNPGSTPFFEAIATEGVGVEDTLKAISALVLRKLFLSPLESYAAAEGRESVHGQETAPPSGEEDGQELFPSSEEMLDSAQESAVFDVIPGESGAESSADSAEMLFVEPSSGDATSPAEPFTGKGARDAPAAGESAPVPPQETPALHLVPGQPMEAVLDIMGTKFKLKISLDPIPEE